MRTQTGYEDLPKFDAGVKNSDKRAQVAKIIDSSLNLIKLPVQYEASRNAQEAPRVS